MSITEWIVSGGLLTVVGLVIKAYRDNDTKITRLYERMDETKRKQEDTYTRKEVCAVLHTQIHSDLAELKSDVKLLLKRGGYKEE